MGYGTYSLQNQTLRSTTYSTLSTSQIFTSNILAEDLSPKTLVLRECRDSIDHPEVIPVIIALDVTGSMAYVPKLFLTEIMTHIMSNLIQKGIEHVQLLFVAFGDHTCDSSPLQVGQFEASDELLEKWLKQIHLEGGGGGNVGESYLLVHYLASRYTVHDAFEKRNTKGFLFTIGDEPTLSDISGYSLKKIFSNGEHPNSITAKQCIEEAQEKYNVFHIHLSETDIGKRSHTFPSWKNLLGQNAIEVSSYKVITNVVSDIIIDQTQQNHSITIDDTEQISDSISTNNSSITPLL